MADTKTTVKIGGDTTDFERALADLVKKTKEVQNQLKLSPAATRATPAGSPGYQTFQQEMQKTRAQEQKNKNEQEALKMTKRGLEEIDRQLATNARNEAKNSKDKAFYERERNNFLKERIALQGTLNRLEGKGPDGVPLPQSGGGGGGGIGKGGVTSLGGLAGFLGVPGAVVGGIASIVAGLKGAEMIRRSVSEAGLRANVAGSAAFNAQGQQGQLLENLFSGGATENAAFSGQRLKAQDLAQSAINSRYSENALLSSGFGNPELAAVMGYNRLVLGKESLGALEHGNFAQAGRAFLGRVGFKDSQRLYEKTRAKEEAVEQEEQYNAIINDPENKARSLTAKKYINEWRNNLAFQRQTGMNEADFRKLVISGNSSGFEDASTMGMSSAIMGAGGSTRSAKENAVFALQMQRRFDLTNAGQAMGLLSGQLGSAGMSKEALIKIQAEGTRIGLNQADFVEENRKFVEMAAGVINQSTVTSGTGVDQVIQSLSRFLGGQTTQTGLQAGKTAFEAYQAQSNIKSGPSAVMRAAGLLNSSVFNAKGGLDWKERNALSLLQESDVTVDSPTVKSIANRLGMDPADVVKEYKRIQGGSIFQHVSTEDAIRKSKAAASFMGPSAKGNTAEDAENNLVIALGTEESYANYSEKVRKAAAHALSTGGDVNDAMKRAREDEIAQGAGGGRTDRAGDLTETYQAEAMRLTNELFKTYQDGLVQSIEATKAFAAANNYLADALKSAKTPAEIAAAYAGADAVRKSLTNPQISDAQSQESQRPPGLRPH